MLFMGEVRDTIVGAIQVRHVDGSIRFLSVMVCEKAQVG